MENEKLKLSLKNKLDLAIIFSIIILITTGAFLRFFKYFFTPETLEKATLILIPESLILIILIAIKIWRN
jgi:hypothetical protein